MFRQHAEVQHTYDTTQHIGHKHLERKWIWTKNDYQAQYSCKNVLLQLEHEAK